MRAKLPTFEEWFEAQNFKHFQADEFTSYFNRYRGKVKNSPPPRALWENIIRTLWVLDDLRRYYNRPIVILSSYRSPVYNAAVGGEPKSLHMKFNAIDFAVAGHSPPSVARKLKEWRTNGKFSGGIGLYPTFVHLDTRGYNATW
jgi:lysozyme